MLLLVPVTLPPGAQAAHTSDTDGETHAWKELRNKDESLPNVLYFLPFTRINTVCYYDSFGAEHKLRCQTDYRHKSLTLIK